MSSRLSETAVLFLILVAMVSGGFLGYACKEAEILQEHLKVQPSETIGIQVEIPEFTLSVTEPPLDDITMTMYDPGSTYVWKFTVQSDGVWWSVGIKVDGTADYAGTQPEKFETALWDSLAEAFPEWFHAHCHQDLLYRLKRN